MPCSVQHSVRSTIDIRGNKYFQFGDQFSLYFDPNGVKQMNFEDTRCPSPPRINYLFAFVRQDRRVLSKQEFIFRDSISSKEVLIVESHP